MTQIIRSWNSKSIRQREDGYVCLTDMANASNKKLNDWLRSKNVENYLGVLSGATGIPVTELVQVFQGGIPENQGTWGHPKVSLRCAQWCSEEFAVQVDCWIDELLTKGVVSLQPIPTQSQIEVDPEKAFAIPPAAQKMFMKMGVDEVLANQIAFKALENFYPQYAPIAQIAAKELGLIQAVKENWLIPSELAQEINQQLGGNLKSNDINQLLEGIGYQRKNAKKKWCLTDLGKDFGSNVPTSSKSSPWSGFQIKWKDTVIPELISFIQQDSAA